jgi:hypothetical protein
MRHHGITHLRLARQLGFWGRRHADEVHPPTSKRTALGFGAEAGSLDRDKISSPVYGGSGLFDCFEANVREQAAEGICNPDMDNQPFGSDLWVVEKTEFAPLGAVKELVGNDDVAR